MNDRIRYGIALVCAGGALWLIARGMSGSNAETVTGIAAFCAVFGLGFVSVGLLRGE